MTAKDKKVVMLRLGGEYITKAASCWIWRGSFSGSHGRKYPTSEVNGRRLNLRRAVYEVSGNQPSCRRRRVRVTCGNSLCLNPAHLEVQSYKSDLGGRPPGK